jgi:uncharacterized membrane protein required for colicin V production
VTRRKTLTILEVFGVVGGLLRFVGLIIGNIVSFFTGSVVTSYIANKLYTWKVPESFDLPNPFVKSKQVQIGKLN